MQFANLSDEQRASFSADVILGSEVSYSQISDVVPALWDLVASTLSPKGAFYTIQSVNRETHSFIVDLARARGLEVHVYAVPAGEADASRTGQKHGTLRALEPSENNTASYMT